jgi:transposase-like protein
MTASSSFEFKLAYFCCGCLTHSPQTITSALQLYFTGESLRNVQKFFKLGGLKINHNTIYKWIKKYVILMARYLEKITPNVADAWRADELYLKVTGNAKYLFALMDDQTRFWIAQQVAVPHKSELADKTNKGL